MLGFSWKFPLFFKNWEIIFVLWIVFSFFIGAIIFYYPSEIINYGFSEQLFCSLCYFGFLWILCLIRIPNKHCLKVFSLRILVSLERKVLASCLSWAPRLSAAIVRSCGRSQHLFSMPACPERPFPVCFLDKWAVWLVERRRTLGILCI